MPISRLARALGAVLTIAALTLTGAAPAGAAPTGGPACPAAPAQLAGQHITTTEGLPDLNCADLHDAVLDNLDLGQVSLAKADAHGASFRNSDLTQATLTGADLRGAHFDDADLTQAEVVGADARDASFSGADLGQADLTGADLRGADLTGASLAQAELVRADLRGARTVLAEAIQADTSDAKVDLLDPGTFQAALLAVLAGLLLLLKSLADLVRGRTPGGRGLSRGLSRLALYAAVNAMLWLIAGMLLPLMYVVVLYPLLAGGVLVFLSGVVRGYRTARSDRPGPNPSPLDFSLPLRPAGGGGSA